MLTESEEVFLAKAVRAARDAGHVFPAMAACEAAIDSSWGESQLAEYNNLFRMKQHERPIYETVQFANCDFETDLWREKATWVCYPDLKACFRDRMKTLYILAAIHTDYALALAAHSANEFVREVSRTWSTDLQRAAKCIALHNSQQNVIRKALKEPDLY